MQSNSPGRVNPKCIRQRVGPMVMASRHMSDWYQAPSSRVAARVCATHWFVYVWAFIAIMDSLLRFHGHCCSYLVQACSFCFSDLSFCECSSVLRSPTLLLCVGLLLLLTDMVMTIYCSRMVSVYYHASIRYENHHGQP